MSKIMTLFIILLIAGCTSDEERWLNKLESRAADASREISTLETRLAQGTLPNARLLSQYARYVKSHNPELSEIADTLAVEGTTESLMFTNLKARLQTVNSQIKKAASQGEQASVAAWQEIDAIFSGARSNNFNMMLTDQINVLADMSDGKLGRVESLSKQASLAANKSTDFGHGSQLVGNPNYGRWKTDSSGSSAWQWFAMYAMFSSMHRSPIYYDRWSYGRDYSYYGSVGRHYYNSPKQRTGQSQVNKRYSDKFANKGKKFQSPYAKPKATSAKVAQQRRNIAKSSFQSKYSRNSRGSASSRNASSRTSRSSSRGK